MDDESLRHNVIMILLDVLVTSDQPLTVKELVSKLGLYSDYSVLSRGLRRITGRGVDGLPGILVFLWQYPSLFMVRDGKVSITSALNLYDSDKQVSEQTRVAIDFYEFQLRRLGAYSVPMSRVFEMRSQASKWVKQISGQSLSQLTDFIKCHSDVFTITSDNCVVLCEHLSRAALNGHTITRIDAPIELDDKVYENTRIIVNTYHGKQIVNEIFKTTNVVTVDLEGVNLGSVRGSITLVQLAYLPSDVMSDPKCNGFTTGTNNTRIYPKIFIFDVWSNPNLVDICLKQLLESNDIKKVFHGCEDDSYALHRDFGVVLNNFIDTQAAHTVINCVNSKGSGQQSEAIGLNGLFERYGGYGCNPLKAVVKKRYVGNSHYWCNRPLSEEMIYYAAYDVYVLLGIYIKMYSFIKQINGQNAKYFEELNRKAAFSRIWSEQDRHYDRPNHYHYNRDSTTTYARNRRGQQFQHKKQYSNRSKTYR
ncbi:unnamed protein product [Medioppia subpectinata]|uniref:3'-5' exonuclease domain-containing protein n=1 Tax=Medioppia subpectinata TaxID=1979941 RepID=A0A7R9PWZ1_9ACAR|nr:unnamed protein product [Medioppia subpectinata]CAG2104224.1 unnamed protein product [Medioppia subpectinata]